MKLITTGATRWVLLIGRYAVKFPRPTHYRNFLQGLLGNDQEDTWWGFLSPLTDKVCPVLWCSPGAFILVMPRCKAISVADYTSGIMPSSMEEYIKVDEFLTIPAEVKEDSFGWYKGRLVAIDYGS